MSLGLYAQSEQDLFVSVEYSEDLNRFETWVSQVQDRFTHKPNSEAGLPVISQTYYTEYVDVYYENDYSMETWMSTPFETMDLEEGIYLEKWMSTPFDTHEELEVEEWMTEALWE